MSQCKTLFFSLPLAFLILTLAGIPAGVAATNLPPSTLSVFRRQATLKCGTELESTPCEVTGFCCPAETQCIPLENKTSVVCCKKGEYCDEILPIPCAASPSSLLPTTLAAAVANATGCGSECCPLGYECAPEGNRCLMKQENLPEDYKLRREEKKDREEKLASCLELLGWAVDGGRGSPEGGFVCRCRRFPVAAIMSGLLPGLVLGFAIAFGYTKAVDIKTRRRTINFNDPSPYDLGWTEPTLSMEQERVAIGYALHLGQSDSRSESPATRKPLTPADFSPNLGPAIPPRGNPATGSGAVSRAANHTVPSPHPPASNLLESRARSLPRPPSDSETEHSSDSYQPSTITTTRAGGSIQHALPPRFHQRGPSRATSVRNYSPAIGDGAAETGGRATPTTERLRGRSVISYESGYTESIYTPSESTSQAFMLEDGVPLPTNPPYESPFAGANPSTRFGGF